MSDQNETKVENVVLISLEQALHELADDASVQDVLDALQSAEVSPADFSVGTLSLLTRGLTGATKEKIAADVADVVKANPGLGLDAIASNLPWPKDLVSSAISTAVRNDQFESAGSRRGAVYFLAGQAPSEDEITQEIIRVLTESSVRMSKADVLAEVVTDLRPEALVRQLFDGLTNGDSAVVVGVGNGPSKRYGLVGRTYAEIPSTPKKAKKTANVGPVIRRIRRVG